MGGQRYVLPSPPPPPPKNFDHWPPIFGQTLCQIASEHPEMCKIFRLRWANMGRIFSRAISCFFRANFFPCLYIKQLLAQRKWMLAAIPPASTALAQDARERRSTTMLDRFPVPFSWRSKMNLKSVFLFIVRTCREKCL